ncbi:hypothetical protein QJS66_09470 [Kocuria rhizophila]|nr:hypothetical protein QJS66_09470 [Kocuria rhizophila]
MPAATSATPAVPGVREDPEGPRRDFYVWSDTDEVPGRPASFRGHEGLNCTFDPVRRSSSGTGLLHQPDLNFENPKVCRGRVRRGEVLAGHGDRRLPGGRHPVPHRGGGHQLPVTSRAPQPLPGQAARDGGPGVPGPRVIVAEANQMPHEVVHNSHGGVPGVPACASTSRSCRRIYYSLRYEKAAPIVSTIHPADPARHAAGHVPAQP